jgi:hypothetical protein
MATRHRARLASCFVAAAMACGCGPSQEQTERDRILASVDELRASSAADTSRRAELVQRLREQSTETPAGARARDSCARAYDLLNEANLLEAALREQVGSQEKLDPVALAARFRRAEEALGQSRGEMELCERASTELRLRK